MVSFLSLPPELHVQILAHLLPTPPDPNTIPVEDDSVYPNRHRRHQLIPSGSLLPIFRLIQALHAPNALQISPSRRQPDSRQSQIRLLYTTELCIFLKHTVTTQIFLARRQHDPYNTKQIDKLWQHTLGHEVPASQLSASVEGSVQEGLVWRDKLYMTCYEEVEFWRVFWEVWDYDRRYIPAKVEGVGCLGQCNGSGCELRYQGSSLLNDYHEEEEEGGEEDKENGPIFMMHVETPVYTNQLPHRVLTYKRLELRRIRATEMVERCVWAKAAWGCRRGTFAVLVGRELGRKWLERLGECGREKVLEAYNRKIGEEYIGPGVVDVGFYGKVADWILENRAFFVNAQV